MASVKEIRDRMKSINDTLKITNAMYLISSNKVRKARRMLAETEPFFFRVQDMLELIMRHMPPGTVDPFLDLGQLPPMEERKRDYLIITDDKGLAGAYNHNIIKAANAEFEKCINKPRIFAVGEVGRSHFQKSGYEISGNFLYTVQSPTISRARDITNVLVDEFLSGQTDELVVICTMMKRGTISEVQVRTLLPLSVPEDVMTVLSIDPNDQSARDDENIRSLLENLEREEFQMLPSPNAVLDNMVPSLLIGYVYGALVEAFCTVQNDRMLAMDAANKNASAMLKDLETRYNRERQSQITQEITEIVSGARANRSKHSEDEDEEPSTVQ